MRILTPAVVVLEAHDVVLTGVRAVLDLDESACAGVVDRIRAGGGTAVALGCDVSDEAQVDAAIDKVAAELGGVDVLVNNAGVLRDNLLHKMSGSDWDIVMNVHLRGAFLCSRAAQRHMVPRRSGKIVNTSSVSALGNRGQANYAAAKAGMHGFTISLARENAKLGITVNTVSPGYVATDMVMAVPEEVRAKIVADIPTGRLGKPEEIAYAVGFLVSDEAAWITGSNLDINGGHHMGW